MKKLIEALYIIQDECKKHRDGHCSECPMSFEGVCCVYDLKPDSWKINDNAQKALL